MMYEPAQHDGGEGDPYSYSQPLEQTQQASQSQHDAFDEWDDTLWGVLKPMHHSFTRVYLRKDKNSITVGRASDNDLTLPHLKISNRHCILRWDGSGKGDSGLTVMDKSSNGTWINGHKIGRGRSAILKDGSDIAFGQWSDFNSPDNFRYVFRYMADGPPASGLYRDYDVGHELGRGSFATVKRAVCRADGKAYAIKMINRHKLRADGEAAATVFLKEVHILERLNHPNICQLKEHFHENENVILVLEFIDGGDLLDYIINRGGVSENETRRFAFQLCKALKYIHSKGIAHRDLKPENILLTKDDPPVLKIADFGLAKAVDSMTRFKTMCGTPIYLAPEVILRNAEEGYSHVVDSWSAGVIIFAMIANSNPFVDDDASVIAISFRSRYIDWGLLDGRGLSIECRRFIERLLEENPAERMTCAEALKHPWLSPLSATDPAALSETPNDSFVSVRANAGSFLDEPLATPQPPPPPPLPAVPQVPQDQQSAGISREFEHIRMEDAASFATEATAKPEVESGPMAGPSAGRSQGRKLERHPMEFAEVDETGKLTSFRAFPKSPLDERPSYVEDQSGNGNENLKRKERSDSLMASSAEPTNGAHNEKNKSEGNEDDAPSEVSLTPVSENGDDGGLESINARKRTADSPAPQQPGTDVREGGPVKRTRAMPADAAA